MTAMLREPMAGNSQGSLEFLEKGHIKKVMQQVSGNKSEAARILGIARKTLREKLQKYQLN
jgi:two-component system response regulator HydG